jgi:hypothetical protein
MSPNVAKSSTVSAVLSSDGSDPTINDPFLYHNGQLSHGERQQDGQRGQQTRRQRDDQRPQWQQDGRQPQEQWNWPNNFHSGRMAGLQSANGL